MIVTKTVEGEVAYNDGEFAEIQTVGTEGIDKDLLLEAIQIHRFDTADSSQEFRRRLPVGAWLRITTTVQVMPLSD